MSERYSVFWVSWSFQLILPFQIPNVYLNPINVVTHCLHNLNSLYNIEILKK